MGIGLTAYCDTVYCRWIWPRQSHVALFTPSCTTWLHLVRNSSKSFEIRYPQTFIHKQELGRSSHRTIIDRPSHRTKERLIGDTRNNLTYSDCCKASHGSRLSRGMGHLRHHRLLGHRHSAVRISDLYGQEGRQALLWLSTTNPATRAWTHDTALHARSRPDSPWLLTDGSGDSTVELSQF